MRSDAYLDGNVLGGVLHEIFGREVTTSWTVCRTCGANGQVGQLHVYLNGPGAVVRCPLCSSVLMTVAHGGGRYWVEFGGILVLEIPEEA